ncbi:hypothetical protein [Legionella shakespearei]|uniref:Uncharacterized protein n=2 Tax=Legionella shakespearei TaxID=45075 RepID=A0A0W0Z7N7_9GAMM|nr:hypothetical protein [Legionella shakespearei]KTD65108.1 hypothetical protein Lsha_0477 [Legionella shakespearei DSM 23087]
MHHLSPDFFSVTFSKLRQYFLKNKKSMFSGDDFAQILKNTPKEVQGISFGSTEYADFSVIQTDIIAQAFSQLHDNVHSLNFFYSNLIERAFSEQ